MRAFRISGPLIALALTACVGTRPEAPLGTAVIAPPAWRTPPGSTAPIDANWWRAFGDPVLTRLVEQALANNTDIGEAASRVMAARARLRLARADLGPELDFNGDPGYSLRRAGGVTTSTETLGLEISASWDVDLFGRLRNLSRAARATLLSTAASRDAVALGIASTTASSYVTLLGLDAQLTVARDTLASNAESLRLARRLASTGYTSQLELRQAEAQYETTEAIVPQVELAVRQQENLLAVLIGDNPAPIERGGLLAALRAPAIPDGLPSDLLRRRPDLYAAEEAVVAADRSLDSARAAMLPQVSLTSSFAASFATVGPSPALLFLAAGNVLAPLLDSGRRRAQADVEAALRDEAAFAYRGIALQAFADVENALAGIRRLDERRVILARSVQTEIALLRIAKQRYQAGYSAYTDELDAERLLLSARLTLAQTETDRLNAYVSLYEAMGGGWPEPVTAPIR